MGVGCRACGVGAGSWQADSPMTLIEINARIVFLIQSPKFCEIIHNYM